MEQSESWSINHLHLSSLCQWVEVTYIDAVHISYGDLLTHKIPLGFLWQNKGPSSRSVNQSDLVMLTHIDAVHISNGDLLTRKIPLTFLWQNKDPRSSSVDQSDPGILTNQGSVVNLFWLALLIANRRKVSTCIQSASYLMFFSVLDEKFVSLCHSYSWRTHLCELHYVVISSHS